MSKKKDAKDGGSRLNKSTTRRQFLKVAGIGGLSAASLYLLGCAASETTTTETVTTTVTAGAGEVTWDYEADVVVIGAGATGIPAAIRARDLGASVIVIEAGYDVGGRAINSGGVITIGGGTSDQIAAGIVDSPDLVFKDLTDWSVVTPHGIADYRYVDREQCRAWADNCAPTYEFLLANGLVCPNPPDPVAAGFTAGSGLNSLRSRLAFLSGIEIPGAFSPNAANGASVIRPLEESARAKGVQFLMYYHMDEIFRETPTSGRVLGVRASYSPTFRPDTGAQLTSYRSDGNIDDTSPNVNIKALKGVIIGTSGYHGNVNMRRIVDPTLDEAVQLHTRAYNPRGQDGSGILAAQAIGASFWGAANTYQRPLVYWKGSVIGIRDTALSYKPDSPVFPLAKGSGLSLGTTGGDNWQNVITVNQVGKRFFTETADNYYPWGTTPASWPSNISEPYVHGDWRNANIEYSSEKNWIAASRQINEGSVAPDYAAGPNWAIFDADAVTRMEWTIGYPNTDPEYFFEASTIGGLAAQTIDCPFSKVPMPAANLEATVARYNSFVDTGVDSDFAKPTPQFKIETPPFYAAWCTPSLHDPYAGLRINGNSQVIDINGEVIASLYAGGEAAGGLTQHGLSRGFVQGYIAAGHAAA